ncbi:hypothetical protein A3K55_00140 [Candidatus Shapirobacteria bacterium RBG_13_44_7]|uniref:Uncharacterized protein n=1 Tax=Candidatus Shapirobacteria bacterium RBG_13_44_7 TaxID=1802149 RepID=A0A1F7SEK6_9BACT|nr:MAG: hypothetical protein A3K55_00140 [Candidatus Shapirobacteria bacterium RBG_13_44_7]
MNWKNNFKKYKVIWVLAIIVLGMGLVRWKYGYKGGGEEVAPIAPTVTPEPTVSIDEEDYPLWRLLPYSEVGFTVDRYIEPLTLMVYIQGVDEKIVAKKIGEWMGKNGVVPETHKIVISDSAASEEVGN